MDIISDAYSFIGAEIKFYGHFEDYSIPDPKTKYSVDSNKLTQDEFLNLVYDYFTNKESINFAYGDDLKEQNACKRTIRNVAKNNKEECETLGKEWCDRQNFLSN